MGKKIQLGSIVKDPITGFQGMAIARSTWLYSCDHIGIQVLKDKEGKIASLEWFDEPRLVVLKKPKQELLDTLPKLDADKHDTKTGGPSRNAPPQATSRN